MTGIVLNVSKRMAKGLEGYKGDVLKLITTRCTVLFLPVPLTQPFLQLCGDTWFNYCAEAWNHQSFPLHLNPKAFLTRVP